LAGCLAAAVIAGGFASRAWPQEGPAAGTSPAVVPAPGAGVGAKSSAPVELTGDSVEFRNDEGKFVADGNVVLRQNNAALYCDRLEFYKERKEAHAIGHVILESDKGTVWADKAFYNFDTERGDFTNARIMAYPMFGKAASITKVHDNYYVLSDGWLSTSDYDDPEYRIKSRTIEIYPGDKAIARHSTMYLGAVPVMYLPMYTQDLRDNRPHLSVIPGYKKAFGAYVLTAYRVYPFSHIETVYHLDLRERVGLAGGVDLKYDPPSYGQGLLKTYYMNEHTIGAHHLWQTPTKPAVVRERYRVEWRHLWTVDPETNFIAQYYKLSDPDFLKTYFEREYRADQNPTTYALLTHSFPKATATLRVDGRANRFDATVQRLPEANVTFSNQPIGDTKFYFKSSNTLSNLVQKDASPTEVHHSTVRLDTDNELSRPFKLSFLEFRPFVGTEQTYYSRLLNKGDENSIRGLFRTGSDVSTKFYRLYDMSYDRYGIKINQLRHVITPTIGYLYQHRPTISSDKLFAYDGVDARNQTDRFALAIENVLQTKRDGKSVDIARSVVGNEYRMHDNEQGSPLRGWGNVTTNNELYPNQYVTVHQDAEFDSKNYRLQTMNIDLYLKDNKKWEFDIGRRYTFNDDDLVTTQLTYKINPMWRTVIYDRWNVDNGVLQEQQYGLVRDLHSWEVEFSFNNKSGFTDSGSQVWIVFRLKAFPSVVVDGGSSFNKSKVGPNGAAL
jgi:lipopolysaccharide assembly outer membrane protein LptD (OstA)